MTVKRPAVPQGKKTFKRARASTLGAPVYTRAGSGMDFPPQSCLQLFLWTLIVHGSDSLQYLPCNPVGPLQCGNNGLLYFKSVYCPGYGYAMQLLQENCSGRTSCDIDTIDIPKRLKYKCCGHYPGTPRVIYACSGSGSDVQPGGGSMSVQPGFRSTTQIGSSGHSLEDQIVIVAVAALIVFLWGCGLVFLYFRYNYTSRCQWLYRKRRTKTPSSVEPVYSTPEAVSSERYVEIHSFPSPPALPPSPPPSAPYLQSAEYGNLHPLEPTVPPIVP